MKKQNFCQSCGMPLSSDPQKGGTNADGSISEKYCSYCYQNGKFTDDCTSVKDFQEKCRQIMVAKGCGKFKAWLFTRGMCRLERWKCQK